MGKVAGSLLPSVPVGYWSRAVDPVGQCLAQGRESSNRWAAVSWMPLRTETSLADIRQDSRVMAASRLVTISSVL